MSDYPKAKIPDYGYGHWCLQSNVSDQSDKEMFDAQLISTLKDRVKELEDGLNSILIYGQDTISGPVDHHERTYEWAIAGIKVMCLRAKALLPKESTDEKRNI